MTTLHVTDRINLYNGADQRLGPLDQRELPVGLHRRLHLDLRRTRRPASPFIDRLGPEPVPQLPARRTSRSTRPATSTSRRIAGLDNPGYHRNDRTLFTTVLTHKWTDKLTQVIETDQGWEQSVPGGGARPWSTASSSNGPPASANWYSFGNWFLYSFNEKLTGVWRSEVFWDKQRRPDRADRRHPVARATATTR